MCVSDQIPAPASLRQGKNPGGPRSRCGGFGEKKNILSGVSSYCDNTNEKSNLYFSPSPEFFILM
jgi:hypothetical protein